MCVLAAAGFLAREQQAPAPVFPLDLLRHLPFVVSNGVAAAMNFVGIGAVFVLTLYLQDVRHRDALAAGAMLLPLFVPLAVMAPLTGRIVARTTTSARSRPWSTPGTTPAPRPACRT